jgi:hypothetical protein
MAWLPLQGDTRGDLAYKDVRSSVVEKRVGRGCSDLFLDKYRQLGCRWDLLVFHNYSVKLQAQSSEVAYFQQRVFFDIVVYFFDYILRPSGMLFSILTKIIISQCTFDNLKRENRQGNKLIWH